MKIGEYDQMMAYMLRPAQEAKLVDDLEPGSLRDELLKDFDPSQETYEEYLQRKSMRENAATGGRVGYKLGGIIKLYETAKKIYPLLKSGSKEELIKLFNILKKNTVTVKRGESGTAGASSGYSSPDYKGKYYTPEGGGFGNISEDARYYSKLGGPEGKPKVLTAELTPEEIIEGKRLRGLDADDPEIGDIILPQSAENKVKVDYLNTVRARIEKILGMAEGGRVGFYAGGVVRLVKLLSDEGKTINEILKEINIKFKELGGGREGKPNDKTGVTNILKKELGEKVYKERYSPGGSLSESKSYGEDVIEKFKELRLTKTETDIEELLGLSPSYQTKLARDLGLEKKSGSTLRSEKFKDAKNIETEIDNLIDFKKGRNENLEEIFEKVKDKEFLIGRNRFGKPSKDQIQKYISQKIMNKNQLSVDGYKQEIKKMLEDRSYVPQGLDPLSIKTEKLTNYHIPNYLQAKEELAKEIPGLKTRMETNISFRKKLKRKEKEKVDPVLKIGRLATKARTKQTGRLDKLAKAGKLSDREEVINWTQTAIQKVSNDQIKKNPAKILAYFKANPDKLKMLGTRVDPSTGDIYYENPNLSFLNDNPKDSSRFFEMDHNREISKGDFLLDVPENRASVPRLLNSGFKRDAEKFLESNPNPNDPKVKKILEEAKKLRVRLKPNVEKGIFKSSDFFDYGRDPVNKINDTISFWTPDFKPQYYPVKKDSLGKIKLGTIGAGGAIAVPTVGYTENDYTQIKQDLISTGQMQGAAIEDAPKKEMGIPAEAIPATAAAAYRFGKPLLSAVGKIAKIASYPSIAAGFGLGQFVDVNPFKFASDEEREAGKSFITRDEKFGSLKEDPSFALAGADLLYPEIAKQTVGKFAKPTGKGILSMLGRAAMNPFGKLARGFTPLGIGLQGVELVNQARKEQDRINEMKLNEPEKYQEYLDELESYEDFSA